MIGGPLNESISRGRFIRLGTTLGVGAAASSTLAARRGGGSGGDSGGENEGSTAIPEGLSGEEAAEGEPIAREEAVEPNSDVAFTNAGSGQPAVRGLLGGLHQACTVFYQGDSCNLACPCHGSVLDPVNGPANGPAPRPEIPLEVRRGDIFLA